MKGLVAYFIACSAMLATASGAFAQEYANPCKDDITKFCAHVRPGRGVIAECLSQNEAQLSKECKSHNLAQLADVLRQTQQVCESDSSKFCGAELQQQGIQLLRCLKTNQTGLSPTCRTKLFEALELMHY